MEIRVLKSFLAVARVKNITRAAEALHISQPALSKQIAELESELGHRLFNRGVRSMTLTEKGFLLERRAREILELAELAEHELKGETGELTGAIRIGAGEVLAMRHVATAVEAIRREHPRVSVKIRSGNADDIRLYLAQGLVEIALFVGHGNYADYNLLELPDPNVWGVLMSDRHPLARKKTITAGDLRTLELVVPYTVNLSTPIRSWLAGEISELKVIGETNLLYNATFFAENGSASVLTVNGLIEHDPERHLVFRPLSPRLTTPNYLAWRKDIPLSSEAKALIGQLRA